ncbi:pyridoxamine 5'-phosphate oxidase family protein [Streptomyces niveus]|uniref:pyridoxamine 5'-phosphate oxidase family protein n=1 Tax=Streptomyces niveus TaxID=193462 RepID=UPI003417F9CE
MVPPRSGLLSTPQVWPRRADSWRGRQALTGDRRGTFRAGAPRGDVPVLPAGAGVELLHGRADPPPGQTNSGAHQRLMRLTERECWDRLGTHGVKRLGLRRDTAPVIVPVNFLVDGRTVVYRTRPESIGAGTPLALEADHLDEERMRGWSVLLTGTTEHITDPTTTNTLTSRSGSRPWAGGSRTLWIRLLPEEISGRVIDVP